jgi:hypothetical protein
MYIVLGVWGFAARGRILIFEVNPVHNMVHLVTGVITLYVAFRTPRHSIQLGLLFGILYGVLAMVGFASVPGVEELLHLNAADNWLHLLTAGAFLGGALLPRSAWDRMNDTMQPTPSA